jgi:hypothetical protein
VIYAYELGAAWPHPIGEGMRAVIEPHDEGPALTLVCGLPRPTSAEIKALRKGRVRLAITSSSSLAWIILSAANLSFDAPYALGVESDDRRAAIAAALARISAWPEHLRGLVTIITVDSEARVIRGLRIGPRGAEAVIPEGAGGAVID